MLIVTMHAVLQMYNVYNKVAVYTWQHNVISVKVSEYSLLLHLTLNAYAHQLVSLKQIINLHY